jgi:hypothetical protein
MDQSLTDRIRERAYEIWVANGRPHGAAEHHWLAAEREIVDAPQMATEPVILDASQTAAAHRIVDVAQTALAAQSPMVKKSSRAPRTAAKRK